MLFPASHFILSPSRSPSSSLCGSVSFKYPILFSHCCEDFRGGKMDWPSKTYHMHFLNVCFEVVPRPMSLLLSSSSPPPPMDNRGALVDTTFGSTQPLNLRVLEIGMTVAKLRGHASGKQPRLDRVAFVAYQLASSLSFSFRFLVD